MFQYLSWCSLYAPPFLTALGGWSNTGGGIKPCPRSACSWTKLRQHDPNAMALSQIPKFDRFWITFNNGQIAVGRHGNTEALMEWTDPNPSEVKYVGIFTGYGSEGYWKFHSFCSEWFRQHRAPLLSTRALLLISCMCLLPLFSLQAPVMSFLFLFFSHWICASGGFWLSSLVLIAYPTFAANWPLQTVIWIFGTFIDHLQHAL